MKKLIIPFLILFIAATCSYATDITYTDKNTGDQFTAADANEIKTAVNSKSDDGHTHTSADVSFDNTISGLAATTAKTAIDELASEKADSSGLGTASTRAAEDTLTDGANLPDGAAILAYATANGWGTGGTDTIGWAYTPLSSAPGTPVAGKVYWADNDNWDPLTYAGTDDYAVMYDGSGYVGIIDINGNLLIESFSEAIAISDGDGTGSLLWAFAFSAQRTITVPGDADATLVGAATTQTLANKTIDGDDNTLQDIDYDFCVAISDESTDLTTGTAKRTFRMPRAMTLTEIRASVNTAPVGSTIIFDVNDSGTTVFSTNLTIDASEETSETAATAAVLSDTALADDAEITIDIDQIGSSTAGTGAKICFIGTASY